MSIALLVCLMFRMIALFIVFFMWPKVMMLTKVVIRDNAQRALTTRISPLCWPGACPAQTDTSLSVSTPIRTSQCRLPSLESTMSLIFGQELGNRNH